MAPTKSTILTVAGVRAALRSAREGKTATKADGLVQGLEIRVGPRGARWSLRVRDGTRQRRWDLGSVHDGDDDAGPTLITLDTARLRAAAVREAIRKGGRPEALIRSWTGVAVEPDASPADLWTWEAAVDRYLDDVQRTRRQATHDDYRGVLTLADFSGFASRRVTDISRQDIARVIAAIHGRGAEAQAEHALRVVRAMWTWLSADARAEETGVAAGLLARMRPPERTRSERGDAASRDADDDGDDDVPPPEALGRALAIARSGALPDRHAALVQILLASAQRRRTVISAHAGDLKDIDDDVVWSIPPANRKTARKRRSRRPHVIPLPGWASAAARRLRDLAPSSGWLVPAAPRGRRAGTETRVPHADAGLLSDIMRSLGVGLSPHAVRRAMATYGERDLGWSPGEARVILDHMEGGGNGDVTREFYALDPALGRKRAMIAGWIGWLDARAAEAVAADPSLADAEAVRERVLTARYGDERAAARLERRRRSIKRKPAL
jgi:hypothetical protein